MPPMLFLNSFNYIFVSSNVILDHILVNVLTFFQQTDLCVILVNGIQSRQMKNSSCSSSGGKQGLIS